VSPSTLAYWKLKLRRERGAIGREHGTQAPTLPPAKFLQLVPTTSEVDVGTALEVVLSGGVIVRIPAGFHEPTLIRILSLLGGR